MRYPVNQLFVLLSAFLLWTAIGCSSGPSDQPELGTVKGKVTMNGQPMANVIVTFQPENNGGKEKGRVSIGKTDEQGNYELGYNTKSKGAKVGQHTVRISTVFENPAPDGNDPKDPIPAKFNVKSEIKKEVQSGENSIDIKLEM
ncbi:hypothetical protein MNBD_PLANCTO02-695 [hydrothermal vent metagenome]|uniref:Carboxypeptidase regulatory-like domain-containing protein n=1 Tax=hydrothermal vent metagenome TaxID=652676 RepID=A0A3B1E6H5_9ZZZZ